MKGKKCRASGGGVTKGERDRINSPGSGEPDGCPTPDNPTCKKAGGPVSGAAPKRRLDKPKRYASGGAVDSPEGGKKKGKGTTVNVIVNSGGDKNPLAGGPIPLPPGGAPAGAPPAPPPAPRPPMGAPMGAPPMPPGGGFKRGGAVKNLPDAGAGSGLGRLQKSAMQKSTHGSGKRGGK